MDQPRPRPRKSGCQGKFAHTRTVDDEGANCRRTAVGSPIPAAPDIGFAHRWFIGNFPYTKSRWQWLFHYRGRISDYQRARRQRCRADSSGDWRGNHLRQSGEGGCGQRPRTTEGRWQVRGIARDGQPHGETGHHGGHSRISQHRLAGIRAQAGQGRDRFALRRER